MNLVDTIKVISSCLITISTVGGAIIWIIARVKNGKNWFKKWIRNDVIKLDEVVTSVDKRISEFSSDILEIKEQLKNHLEESKSAKNDLSNVTRFVLIEQRRKLKPICEKILERGYITPNEHQFLEEAADLYLGLGGNSHVGEMLDRCLTKLDIKSINKDDKEEEYI